MELSSLPRRLEKVGCDDVWRLGGGGAVGDGERRGPGCLPYGVAHGVGGCALPVFLLPLVAWAIC